jgi:hypothetical protein
MDKTEFFTKLVAGTINRLYNNEQIKVENCFATQHVPIIDSKQPTCRNRLDSALLTMTTSPSSQCTPRPGVLWLLMMPDPYPRKCPTILAMTTVHLRPNLPRVSAPVKHQWQC